MYTYYFRLQNIINANQNIGLIYFLLVFVLDSIDLYDKF